MRVNNLKFFFFMTMIRGEAILGYIPKILLSLHILRQVFDTAHFASFVRVELSFLKLDSHSFGSLVPRLSRGCKIFILAEGLKILVFWYYQVEGAVWNKLSVNLVYTLTLPIYSST